MEYNNQELCARSRIRSLGCRIELLDKNYNIVDFIQGETTSGSIALTNNSSSNKNGSDSNCDNFSRLSGSLEMIISKDLTTDYFKLDFKHLVRIIMIITDIPTGIKAEYNLGVALLNSPTISRGVEGNNKLTISLNDLISNYNGDFSGDLDHTVKVESSLTSGANITQTLKDIVTNPDLMNLDIGKINFENNSFMITQDITCEAGNPVTDLIKSIFQLQMNYELFFNPDGILVYQRIKKYDTDSPIQDFINSPNIISYNIKNDSTNVRNVITVLGTVKKSDDNKKKVDKKDKSYQYTATSTLDDYNPNHPFSIKNIGVHKKVITNDKGTSDEYCKSQADFNLDKYSNYAQVLEISMIPDFRLIPNRVITVQYEDENLTIEKGRYLIDTVTFGLKPSDLATVVCHKLYPNITT